LHEAICPAQRLSVSADNATKVADDDQEINSTYEACLGAEKYIRIIRLHQENKLRGMGSTAIEQISMNIRILIPQEDSKRSRSSWRAQEVQ